MSDCRATKSLWFHLKKCIVGYGKHYGRWKSTKDLFRLLKKVMVNEYTRDTFLHDSFGRYWNQWIVCKIKGHGHVQNVSDPGEPKRIYCFKCERDV